MARVTQLSLPAWNFSRKLAFGGSNLKSNPKTARPIALKSTMHLIMRSSFATGSRSFLNRADGIAAVIELQARRFGIRVYDLANAGNHLHLVIKVPSRRAFRGFLRAVTGLIARKVLGAERGSAWKGTKFWDARPFTRIVAWGRDYTQLRNYLFLNRVEAIGFDRLSAKVLVARDEFFPKNSS